VEEKDEHDYMPNPVDTSDVALSASLMALSEHVAENCHDVWAIERIQQGWRWGSRRDDTAKTHPNLVPYDELTPLEQGFDVRTSMETIKTIVTMKYSIAGVPRQSSQSCIDSKSIASDKSEPPGSPKPMDTAATAGNGTISIPYGRNGEVRLPPAVFLWTLVCV
jgi:RyR domain